MPSSMVIEFKDKEDLKQACYEATVDLNLYIEHLLYIAKRCEKHFPEVAAGLRGTVSGIGQYLRGVDGEWHTGANDSLKRALSNEHFQDHMWAYEFCRDPRAAVMLFATMIAVAEVKPEMQFWDVLKLSRAKMESLEPLIEQLLANSPMRKPQ